MILTPSWFVIAISRHAARVVWGAGGECMCGERPSVGGHHWSSAIRLAMHVLRERITRIAFQWSSLSACMNLNLKSWNYIFIFFFQGFTFRKRSQDISFFIEINLTARNLYNILSYRYIYRGFYCIAVYSRNKYSWFFSPDFSSTRSSPIPGWRLRRY